MKNLLKMSLILMLVFCVLFVLSSCDLNDTYFKKNDKVTDTESESNSIAESAGSESESEIESGSGGLANRGDLPNEGWGPFNPVY